jgi:hypothetical protein
VGGAAAPEAASATLVSLEESRPDRYLIRNATLRLDAPRVKEAASTLVTEIKTLGGYVSKSVESADGPDRTAVTLEVRVPHTRFDQTVQRIETLGTVLEKRIDAEDVTEEFVDSQASLRNLKRTEARLLEHLQGTARLSDTLLVEQELSRIRGEIEQLEGRLRFLRHRIAFSTITVLLAGQAGPGPVTPLESYSTGKQAADATRSLVAFGRVVWTAAIWLAVWAVVWAPVGLAAWLLYRRRRHIEVAS